MGLVIDRDMRQAAAIQEIFERREPDGRYHYSDADVRHFLPLMAMSARVETALYPELQVVMDELAERMGAPITLDAVRAYYAANPVNGELLDEYRAYWHTQARPDATPPELLAPRYGRQR